MTEPGMIATNPVRRQRLHPWPVRVMHWINAAAMLIMITSGWGIYDDDVIIGGLHFSHTLRLGSWAAESLLWHFAGMWVLVINGLVYLIYGVATGRFLERLFPVRVADVVQTVRDTLRFHVAHDDLTVYNAVQKLLYMVVILAGISQVDHRAGDLEAGPVLGFGQPIRRLPGRAAAAFPRHGGDRGLPSGPRRLVAAGARHAQGHADRRPAGGTPGAAQERRAMKSLFRPAAAPKPGLLDDHRPLVRAAATPGADPRRPVARRLDDADRLRRRDS